MSKVIFHWKKIQKVTGLVIAWLIEEFSKELTKFQYSIKNNTVNEENSITYNVVDVFQMEIKIELNVKR